MKTELVEMPEGLLEQLQGTLPRIPASAFGNAPIGSVKLLLDATAAARVVPPPTAE